ncbi:hypothetical protein HY627_02415 [Candidatus Uhrbacteria bacterium]|nr:hypothetical protein [Candidatus Uhrbacteria bacterium]
MKSIKPRPEWTSSTRDILLSQIKAQGVPMVHANHSKLEPAFVYTRAGLADVYRYTLGLLFASPRNAFVTLFLLVGTSIGLASASESSIPGSPLYSVKKTKETLASAVVSPEARAQFEADRATRRMEEFKALEETEGRFSDEEKELALSQLAEDATETFATVDHSLDSLKKASEPKKLVAVAQSITEKADAAKKALDASKPTPAHEETIAKVVEKIDETSRRALSVLVEKQDSAGIPESAITDQLAAKLTEAESDLLALEARVSAAALPKDENTALVEKSDRAKRMISEAQALLSRKDFKIALDRLNESKLITRALSETLRRKRGDADVKLRNEETNKNENKTEGDLK